MGRKERKERLADAGEICVTHGLLEGTAGDDVLCGRAVCCQGAICAVFL